MSQAFSPRSFLTECDDSRKQLDWLKGFGDVHLKTFAKGAPFIFDSSVGG
jgi:hypothetical protein